MKNRTIVASLLLLAVSSTTMAQNSSNSMAGGLPALAAEVEKLKQQIASLQNSVSPAYPAVYAGSYFVVLAESGSFGCGTTNNPAALLGTPAFAQYLSKQAISSNTADTAVFTVESDGYSLQFPEFTDLRMELRLSGKLEFYNSTQEAFSIDINGDGSLAVDPALETDYFSGQMSSNGNIFTILAGGNDVEDTCIDGHSTMLIGIRI